jgi:hypothetical protein
VILDHELVRSDAHVKRILFAPAVSLELALFLGAEVSQYLQGWAPSLELHFPVDNNRSGYDNEVRSPDTLIAGHRRNHRDSLDSLTQAHLISQDTVEPLVMKRYQPVQSDDLILAKLATQQEWDLCLHLCTLQRKTSRRKRLSHLNGKLSHVGHLFVRLSLWKELGVLQRFFLDAFLLVHALLHETMGIQLFRHFDTKF